MLPLHVWPSPKTWSESSLATLTTLANQPTKQTSSWQVESALQLGTSADAAVHTISALS